MDIQALKKEAKPKDPTENNSWLSFLNKDIAFGGSGLSDKLKESFYLELSILIGAGMDIKSALEIIMGEQRKLKVKTIYTELRDKIIAGSSLSHAMQQSGKFSAYEYYSIQIGEETGKTLSILENMAEYHRKKIKQRRQLVSALTYPGIVLLTSVGAVFFMLNFMVPMFSDIFKRFKGELPLMTRGVIAMSDFLRSYSLWMLLFIGVVSYAFYSQRNTIWFKKNAARLLLNLPVIGDLLYRIYLARFCSSMGLLLGAKVNMIRTLQLVKQMIDFYPMEQSLDTIQKEVMNGIALNKSMSQFAIYDTKMIAMIKVGEEVNQLDNFFNRMASQYSDEVEYKSSIIGSLIEPFLILFLGVVVGALLVAMYLPLFQLSSTF